MEFNKNGSPIQADCPMSSDCRNGGLSDRQLAMVYCPCQSWHKLYTPEMGLKRGTIFEELDKPLEEACG